MKIILEDDTNNTYVYSVYENNKQILETIIYAPNELVAIERLNKKIKDL